MNLEMLDGFFAALICCPDTVPPSEYLAEIWGGEMADEDAFASEQDVQDFLHLVMPSRRRSRQIGHKNASYALAIRQILL